MKKTSLRSPVRLTLKKECVRALAGASLKDVHGGLLRIVLDTCDMGPNSCKPGVR